MKTNDIIVGNLYLAKVSGRLVLVQVLGRHTTEFLGRTKWHVLNLATGRRLLVGSRRLRPVTPDELETFELRKRPVTP